LPARYSDLKFRQLSHYSPSQKSRLILLPCRAIAVDLSFLFEILPTVCGLLKYAVTSYGSQGKTVDHVLFSDSTIKAATNAQQWYNRCR
jgi:hypothetical protein